MVINFDGFLIFLLVMLRMTGLLMFNPIFSRQNVPRTALTGLAFVLAVLISGTVPAPDLEEPYLLVFLYWVVKELLVGLTAGFILRMFMSVLIIAGDGIDMQIGISMAKAFDPGSNSSVALTAQYLNIMFYMTFFLTNAHLNMIQMTAQSFRILPLGSYLINPDSLYLIPQLFTNILLLAVKLTLPVIVIEVVTTFAVGMIMRVVPQINIFVLNIQIKLTLGMLILVMLMPSFMGFVENIIIICAENIQEYWINLAA